MNNITKRLEAEGVQVNGTFDVQLFFDTLARILSQKENMDITVKVAEPVEQRIVKNR